MEQAPKRRIVTITVTREDYNKFLAQYPSLYAVDEEFGHANDMIIALTSDNAFNKIFTPAEHTKWYKDELLKWQTVYGYKREELYDGLAELYNSGYIDSDEEAQWRHFACRPKCKKLTRDIQYV
jgi:hypothetical protein